jgi:hypothetical protein
VAQFQSQGGGPFDPIAYNSGVYQPSPRPTSVTVISIFAIVLGSLGLLCGGVRLVMQLMMLASGGRNPFAPGVPPLHDSALTGYNTVNSLISLILSCGFVGAGIGGLKLWPPARRGLIGLSIFVIFFATITLVVQLLWVGPRTLEYTHQIQRHLGQPAPPPFVGDAQKIAQVVGAFIGWVLWCALPVCVLIFWRSPRVIAAFEPGSLPPPGTVPGSTWPPTSAPPGSFR